MYITDEEWVDTHKELRLTKFTIEQTLEAAIDVGLVHENEDGDLFLDLEYYNVLLKDNSSFIEELF